MLSPDIKIAYLFTGQGSIKKPGMWDQLSQSSVARRIFEMTDEVAGFPLSKLVAEGPMEKLIQTKNAQLAIVATDLAMLAVTREFHPELDNLVIATAGHSAGEIAALVGAGVLDETAGIALIRQRGLIMQEYGGAGTMAALLTDDKSVREICDRANKKSTSEGDTVEAVNLNSPQQTVISGAEKRVMRAVNIAEEEDIIFSLLSVSNPFHHSVLMKPAQVEFAKVIAATEFRDTRVPVILNVTGQPETSGVKIKEILAEQIASPVLWYKSMLSALAGEGLKGKVNMFIEFGPRGILTGILKEIDPNVRGVWIGNSDGAAKLNLT